MNVRKPSSRWALWAFAAALLLKAAMPWLASASAGMQGKPLVEVCTVYGVSLVLPAGGEHAPAGDHSPDHGSEHCALSALASIAAALVEPITVASTPTHETGPPCTARLPEAPDACARWSARLRHGPPAFS